MPHTTSGFRPSRKRSIPTTSSTSRHPSGNLNPLRPSTVTLLWHLFGLYSYIIMNHRFFSLGHSILARCILLLITGSSISGVDSCSCGFISHTTIGSFFNVNFNQFGHSRAFIRLWQRDLVRVSVTRVGDLNVPSQASVRIHRAIVLFFYLSMSDFSSNLLSLEIFKTHRHFSEACSSQGHGR